VGRGAKFFQLLASEDVDGDQMDFGVAVLAGLGSGHFDDLARAAFDDDETVLPQRRALHWVGGGGASIGAFEGMFMLSKSQYVSDVCGLAVGVQVMPKAENHSGGMW